MASTVWKGHLTFGLVSLPVKLYSAARGESVSFNQLHKEDGSRVRQVLYCAQEDKPIPRSEIVKGYEYEKGKYVVVDDEDIKKVAPKTARVMEIQEFVKVQLAAHEYPRFVQFAESLPMTATGKVLRRELRALG